MSLHEGGKRGSQTKIIIGSSVRAAVLLVATIAFYFFIRKGKRNSNHEIEEATKKFEKKISSRGFGDVFYGKLKDGREIAVKVLTNDSNQGKIHHRNLVQFLGYCQEDGRNMLVYEFMHNGTLKEHLYGIEYLHTRCVPAIIHRDLKSTNILLDSNLRAKVSDFGPSKSQVDGVSHVSSVVRGTVGYLDPEYCISQQSTDKNDVYSFGVILLELISGREAISNESSRVNCCHIVQRDHTESGDIQGIIDPNLREDYDVQSMRKIAEKALMCIQPNGHTRPSISEVLKEIQDALLIEREALARNSFHSSVNMDDFDIPGTESYVAIDESIAQPTAQ
ncbi:hypothetical protein EUGRSUZ_D00797 [Eucalyptus grandis]|uniref:Protein kinase domain-containing protein n=2 Tax=Eucalyptus grandis TaxID=71139 RepID=A0A059CER1_EUCGR|nr:hypothetical protein EUGRSUZ_D00797 [Eucalyptus grandis]